MDERSLMYEEYAQKVAAFLQSSKWEALMLTPEYQDFKAAVLREQGTGPVAGSRLPSREDTMERLCVAVAEAANDDINLAEAVVYKVAGRIERQHKAKG